jgi:hypothetical protein
MAMLHRESLLRSSLCSTLVFSALACGVWGCKGSSTPPAPEPTAAAPEGKPAEPVMGKLDEKNFSVEMKSTGPYKAGQPSNVGWCSNPRAHFIATKNIRTSSNSEPRLQESPIRRRS